MDATSLKLLISVVVILIFFIFAKIKRSNKQNTLIDKFKKIKNFELDRGMISNDLKKGIAVDNTKNKICILKNNKDSIDTIIYEYRDLLESEILEDGESVTKTSRGSQLGGALLGGMIFGGVGAVIGGLSGKKTHTDKVSSIDLKIIVNDINSPMIIINFMSLPGAEKSTTTYKNNIQSAREWNSLLSVLIKKADKEDLENNKKSIVDNKKQLVSLADEIIKLKSLKEDGIITEEEFQNEKNNLLH